MFLNLILSLANTFLLEMVIAKDPSYLFVMYSVTVACHLTLCSNNMGTHNERISEFLSASIILLYMYQPKNVYLILIVSF